MPNQGGGEARQGGGGLDAVAALADQPEEAVLGPVMAGHRIAIRHEGAQPAPGALDAGHFHIDSLLEAVDAFGQRHVIGIGIMRLNRCGIGG